MVCFEGDFPLTAELLKTGLDYLGPSRGRIKLAVL